VPQSLSFQRVVHAATKIDCQPAPDNGVLVMVMGQLQVPPSLDTRAAPHRAAPARVHEAAPIAASALHVVMHDRSFVCGAAAARVARWLAR